MSAVRFTMLSAAFICDLPLQSIGNASDGETSSSSGSTITAELSPIYSSPFSLQPVIEAAIITTKSRVDIFIAVPPYFLTALCCRFLVPDQAGILVLSKKAQIKPSVSASIPLNAVCLVQVLL